MAKINGRRVERYTGTVHFWRDVDGELVDLKVTVVQPPPNWGAKFERVVQPPAPPLSDKYELLPGGERRYKPNDDDPKYRAEMEHYEELRLAAKLYDCTVSGLEWETQGVAGRELYEGVWRELEDGFGRGEVLMWAQIIEQIGYVGGADIAYYEEQFFRVARGLGALPAAQEGNQERAEGDDAVPGDAASDDASLDTVRVPVS